MPAFSSRKQQGYMFANLPKTAKKMADRAKAAGEPVVVKGKSTKAAKAAAKKAAPKRKKGGRK